MIVTEEVKHPVYEEPSEFGSRPVTGLITLNDSAIPGDDNIPQQVACCIDSLAFHLRKGKDIREAVFPPVLSVEGADLLISGYENAQLRFRIAQFF
jgi:hypothetical protein